MANDWQHYTWEDIVSLEYGKALRGYADAKGEVRVFGSNGPVGWTDKAIWDGPGVILGRKGAYRGVEFSAGPFYVIDTAYYLVPKIELDLRWLYYAVIYHRLGEIDDGSPIPSTTRAAVYVRELDVPDIREQREIASILAALDDKIELNRRMNETLEGMAQAIFRDWFVDFGPVRRAAAGATDPVAIMGGLTSAQAHAAQFAALFPAAFGHDGFPVGWSDGSLARLALINSESWKASNHPAEVEYVDLSNTKWGNIEATARLTWEAAPSRARRIARKGDSIIGTVRPGNGSYAYIGRDGYTVSTGFAVLRPREAIYTDAIYVAATAADNIARLANLADSHGGAYPAVNPDVVGATPFPVVPDALFSAFSKFASPLRDKIEQAKLENQTLCDARDYLLPRLMSGAVCVADVGSVLEGMQ